MKALNPAERAIAKENFHTAIGVTRREFLGGSLAAAAVGGTGLGAYYFSYSKVNDPVRIGVIGTGDEGSVLIGAHNPEYARVVAIADIRPYNIHRAFHGDESSPNALRVRPGLMSKYGWKSEDEARKNVKVYTESYEELLNDKDVEAVIIALPLHLHAEAVIKALQKGKHVLCEKLMAHSVAECKDMGRVSQATGKILSVGHQRHYSILYDNAVEMIRQGLIGDVHYIQANWHRGNLPGRDSWKPDLPDAEMEKKIDDLIEQIASGKYKDKSLSDRRRNLAVLQKKIEDKAVQAEKYGYIDRQMRDRMRSALEELIHWRLWDRTGGGLMAELGGHQLDAASIFVAAVHSQGGERNRRDIIKPLSVSAVGGRHIFPFDRDIDDHVYCSYEFPGREYAQDPNKKIVVTYSSINGNGYGGYGENVYGTTGNIILDREEEVLQLGPGGSATAITVKAPAAAKAGGGGPTMDTTESGGGGPTGAALGAKALGSGPPSRGYKEEIEHLAWCIRNPDSENQPRCDASRALADAVMALCSNYAMRDEKRINFKPEWFDINSDATPEGKSPTQPATGKPTTV